MSLTSDQPDTNNLAIQRFEATDQSDVSGCRLHGGEDYLTAETPTQTIAIIFPEPEVSPCTSTHPV